jgi:CTP-dependent riboflavin kinase
LPHKLRLGDPHIDWVGRNRNRTRDYQFWDAWIDGYRCHAMVPGNRGHGPNAVEIVAPDRLRAMFSLGDGDRITVDIDANR